MTAVVLIGGGVATTAAAAGLRSGGFDGEVVLVSEETHPPYERPPVSKEFLAGTVTAEDFALHPRRWYEEAAIDLVLGVRAESFDPAAHSVRLSDGRTLHYAALVLGTGARARTVPDFEGEHTHVLRTIDDAGRLDGSLREGSRVAVLGGGFVGCEAAAVAVGRGASVTLFSSSSLPLERTLGPEIGQAMLEVHRHNGVDVRCGETVTAVRESPEGLELETSSGEVFGCDELVIGVGSVPNSELAVAAGLDVDGGILTDEFGCTSVPDVYAIGDVAARFHPVYGDRVRAEHHDTAMRHGQNLALNILGDPVPFTEEHYFWSDQYEHKLQSIGHYTGSDGERVVRGSIEDRAFSIFTVADGRIRAMVAMNRPGDLLQVRKLLSQAHVATAEELADEKFPIKRLLPQRSRRTHMEVS